MTNSSGCYRKRRIRRFLDELSDFGARLILERGAAARGNKWVFWTVDLAKG